MKFLSASITTALVGAKCCQRAYRLPWRRVPPGTGAPVLTGAVAAMADEPFDYIGLPFNDTASVNTLVTEMNDTSGRWSYARQLYGHVYTAKIGTLSELVTAGDQFNQQHITLAG